MNILKRMRRMAKFTGEQVADYLGISQSNYSVIEQGNINDCPFDTLEKLAALYHVEEYDLLNGTAVPHTLCETPAQEAELIPFASSRVLTVMTPDFAFHGNNPKI